MTIRDTALRANIHARLLTPAPMLADAYKLPHADMYPDGMQLLFSTWTPRSDKIALMAGRQLIQQKRQSVFFGLSAAIARISNEFEAWFARDTDECVNEYVKFVRDFLKVEVDGHRIRALHELGYLPFTILALPEGTVTNMGVVQMVIFNHYDKPEFAWLTNYVESLLSTELWKQQTSATIALNYYKLLRDSAALTCDNGFHLPWQAHDFAMRGLSGVADSESSALGHLVYFNGTDNLPAVWSASLTYDGFTISDYGSVPATEHSVMCAGGKADEVETFRRLMKIYPTGILSVVSDTWDYWHVLTNILPQLKDEIMARDGKLVIRPDSGDPVKIICGDSNAKPGTPAFKGSIELLGEVFGFTTNSKGYRELDSHIGLIYGDSITLERAEQILMGLARKEWASNNVVLGVGSYTYQATTRDVWGFAMKATAVIINGEERAIFKDPVTDDGTKKSFKGFLTTRKGPNGYYTVDGLSYLEACRPDLDGFDSAFVEYQIGPQAPKGDWDHIRELAHKF